MKLYELNAALQAALDNAFDPETGEITPEGETRLAEIETARDEKALDVACAIKSMKAEQEAVHKEKSRLEAKERALRRTMDWLRDYLAAQVPVGVALKDARAAIGWHRVEAVEIDEDAPTLPTQYLRVTIEPNKTLVKEALKKGEELPGCRIVTRESVVVR